MTSTRMLILCLHCGERVNARLTNGAEIYPQRPDLKKLPFWRCDECGNYVGCHHKTENRLAPLGCIPTPEIRDERRRLHALIDPLWRSGKITGHILPALPGRWPTQSAGIMNATGLYFEGKFVASILRRGVRS